MVSRAVVSLGSGRRTATPAIRPSFRLPCTPLQRFEEGIAMFRRIQNWFLTLFLLAPWLLLPMMPVMAAVLWAYGIG
jgi:hypothetical protein